MALRVPQKPAEDAFVEGNSVWRLACRYCGEDVAFD